MIKLITIDLDNTLWDSTPVLLHAEKVMAQWLGEQVPAALAHLKTLNWTRFKAGLIAQEPDLRSRLSALRLKALQTIMLNVGLPVEEADQQAQAAFEVFLKARQNVTLFEQAKPLLEALSQRYHLVSITNGNASLEAIGLDHYFNHMISADQFGLGKPAPAIFLHALKLADVAPHETVHIGDHLEDDIQGAEEVGMHAIWYNPTGETPENPVRWQVEQLADVIGLLEEIEDTI